MDERATKEPPHRCQLDDLKGKRLDKIHARVSPDLKLALKLEAEQRGEKISSIVERVMRRHLQAQRLQRPRYTYCPIRSIFRELHLRLEEALEDGELDREESIDLNDSALEFLSVLKDRRKGVAA